MAIPKSRLVKRPAPALAETEAEKSARFYTEVCELIGANPKINFVKINPDGSIGFTLGHPDEIDWLQQRCLELGLAMTPQLAEFKWTGA